MRNEAKRNWDKDGWLKAEGSKRKDDGRLRIEAEAKKSVASKLQRPKAFLSIRTN
jgi:hypothetical protein